MEGNIENRKLTLFWWSASVLQSQARNVLGLVENFSAKIIFLPKGSIIRNKCNLRNRTTNGCLYKEKFFCRFVLSKSMIPGIYIESDRKVGP